MTDARSGGGPWRNRTILVTGGTSGIGWQFAIHFAAEGAKVIACGLNDMALRKLQAEHPRIEAIQCDITARPNVLALVETIRDRYGMLDVLLNNAGIMERVDLLDESVSDERIAHEIAVNLTGPILLTRRLLPLLRSGRSPIIVMVTSGYALLPATHAPTYSATKAGLHSFTLALRRQLHGVGIRVVEVLPPLVDTPATRTVSKAKMSPAVLVDQVMRDISRGEDEIMLGKVRLLPMLMRLAPSLAARVVAGS